MAGTVSILSAPALGDGLLALVLAHNLAREGRASVVYHTQLTELHAWFPWAHIEPVPDVEARARLCAGAGPVFVGDRSWLPDAADVGPGTRVFTKADWDRSRHYLRSLQRFAEAHLGVRWETDANAIEAVDTTERAGKRVVLHPFSARPAKDWPVSRWNGLAVLLRTQGWSPVVLLAPGEEARWAEEGGEVPVAVPGALDAVAAFLRASSGVVAGDSGIGHLASNVGTPTLSLFRKASSARFWRPAWGRTAVVAAPWRLPGGRGHRFWGRLLAPRRVARCFGRVMAT